MKFLQDTGAFVVHAGIDNRRVTEALEVILQELREIKENEVDKSELKRAKEYYIGQLLLALESTSEHMLWMGENFVSLNRFLQPREIIRCINKIDADDIKKTAIKILQNRNLNLAIVGPLKEKDKNNIKKGLKL